MDAANATAAAAAAQAEIEFALHVLPGVRGEQYLTGEPVRLLHAGIAPADSSTRRCCRICALLPPCRTPRIPIHSHPHSRLLPDRSTARPCPRTAVGVVALLWDHIITFPTELRLVWTRPFTGPKAVFLFLRYVVSGSQIVIAYGASLRSLSLFRRLLSAFCCLLCLWRFFVSLRRFSGIGIWNGRLML